MRISAVRDLAGRIVEFLGISRDITERRRVGQHLRLQAAALQAAANAILITDRSGVIEWVNAAFTRLTGYEPSEAVGQSPRLLKSGRQDVAPTVNCGRRSTPDVPGKAGSSTVARTARFIRSARRSRR
jgi:PAS domain-containing protein